MIIQTIILFTMHSYDATKIASLCTNSKPNHQTPKQFKTIKLQTPFDSYTSVKKINQYQNLMIQQALKSAHLKFQSIFLIESLFEDQSSTPKQQNQRETYQTEVTLQQVEKKGFQFYQYTANSPIEDSMCSFEIPELNAFAVSIFDGHGGSDLSRFCAKNISSFLKKYIQNGIKLHKYQNNKIQLIKDGLTKIHFQLQDEYYKHYLRKIQTQKKKFRGVGTCAITVVMYENKCIVATCGDSQAIVISQNKGAYNYQKLSERYSVSNKAQRQRLLEKFKGVDDNVVVEERKNTFYLKGMLQPTKSIGDYYLKHKEHYIGEDKFQGPYLSCEPEIKVYDIKGHDKQIIVASDGLWDYLNKWEIVKHVVEARNGKVNIAERQTQSQNQDDMESVPIECSRYLTQKILEKVSNDFDFDINYLKSLELGERRSYHDDITIGIIDLGYFFYNFQSKN